MCCFCVCQNLLLTDYRTLGEFFFLPLRNARHRVPAYGMRTCLILRPEEAYPYRSPEVIFARVAATLFLLCNQPSVIFTSDSARPLEILHLLRHGDIVEERKFGGLGAKTSNASQTDPLIVTSNLFPVSAHHVI